MSFGDQIKKTINQVFPKNAISSSSGSEIERELLILREANLELLEILGSVVDALSPNTLYHSTQVAVYALYIACKLGLPKNEQERIFKAGLVHDVGMICLSSAALACNRSLSDEEFESLRLHPTVGAEIVGRISHLRELAPLVHHHHERYDGNGYPDRLAGDEIPLGARILALADSLDALLTERPGRSGYSLDEVIVEVRRCSGSQFDPEVVRAFMQLVDEQGKTLFTSSNHHARRDMLLGSVGISSGRVRKVLQEVERKPVG